MKLRFKFLLLLLPVLLLPSFVKAEERTLTGEWKKIEAGTSIISLEKKGEFIEQLEAKIKALTDASAEDGTVYDYSYRVIREYQEESKSYVPVNVENIFTTREEANEYYNDLEVKGKTNPTILKTYNENTKEIVCETDCEDEKLEDYVCKVTPLDYKDVTRVFTNLTDLGNYVPEEVEGYTFDSKGEATPFNVPKAVDIDENYGTETEANTALSTFVGLYGGSGVVTKYRDTTKDVSSKISGTTQYDSEEDAIDAKNTLQTELNSEVFAGEKTAVVREGSINVTNQYTIESVVTDPFDSDTAANAYLNDLEGMGYTIISSTVSSNTTYDVTSNTNNDNSKHYTFGKDTSYVLISQKERKKDDGREWIVIWTPVALSLAEQAQFEANFSDTNNSLTRGLPVYYISGFNTTGLAIFGDNYNYDFLIDSKELKLNLNKEARYVVYGTIDSETTYTLTGLMSRVEPKAVWYVDVNVLTYGYSYNVKATGTDYDVNYKLIVKYRNNINKMECSIPTYKLSYEVENITYKNYAEIEWFVGSQFLGSGDTKPPVTNLFVETVSYTKYFMISFIGLLILFKARKYIFNK